LEDESVEVVETFLQVWRRWFYGAVSWRHTLAHSLISMYDHTPLMDVSDAAKMPHSSCWRLI